MAGAQENTSTVDYAAQCVLAEMVRRPETPAWRFITSAHRDTDDSFRISVLLRARELTAKVLGSSLRPHAKEDDQQPTFVDRLSLSWSLLRQADIQLRKVKKAELPMRMTVTNAAGVFAPLLPGGASGPLVTAILEALRVGADAQYLSQYSQVRRARKPNPEDLPPPFTRALQDDESENLARLISWCIRSHRERYVEVSDTEPVRVEFSFLVEAVIEDLQGWFGKELDSVTRVAGQVEVQVNDWLSSCRLQESNDYAGAADFQVDPEIAKAFVKHHGLNEKLRIHRAGDATTSNREAELEAQVRRYSEENRSLEDRVRELESGTIARSANALSTPVDMTALKEVLKTVDGKYALSTLKDVQLGTETHLTLRSFVSHLFYSLRKQGLAEYPDASEFDLSYDQSGFFDCQGFEVSPSDVVRVQVVQRGWALKTKTGLLPIRKARVIPVGGGEGDGQ